MWHALNTNTYKYTHIHTHAQSKKKTHLPLLGLRFQRRQRPHSSPCRHSSALRRVFTTQRQMVSWHCRTLMSLGGLREAHLSAQFYYNLPLPPYVHTSTEKETEAHDNTLGRPNGTFYYESEETRRFQAACMKR